MLRYLAANDLGLGRIDGNAVPDIVRAIPRAIGCAPAEAATHTAQAARNADNFAQQIAAMQREGQRRDEQTHGGPDAGQRGHSEGVYPAPAGWVNLDFLGVRRTTFPAFRIVVLLAVLVGSLTALPPVWAIADVSAARSCGPRVQARLPGCFRPSGFPVLATAVSVCSAA